MKDASATVFDITVPRKFHYKGARHYIFNDNIVFSVSRPMADRKTLI